MAITGIDTIEGKQIIAAGAVSAKSADHLSEGGTMGKNITQSDGANNFLYMPNTSPWKSPTGIFSPLQYATGACLAMDGGNFAAYFKGNEWYVSNNSIGQALRGEVHAGRGVHISGATIAGYGFNLGITSVSGVNSTGSWKYGHAEDAALRAVSSCDMHESAFGYDANDKISGYNGSAFAGGSDVPEGVMVESGLEYNAVNEISGYNGSAIAQYGAEKQWLVHDDTLVHAANSAQYALGVNVSALQRLMGIDETVLFFAGNDSSGVQSGNLTESIKNFKRIRVAGMDNDGHTDVKYIYPAWTKNADGFSTSGYEVILYGANPYAPQSTIWEKWTRYSFSALTSFNIVLSYEGSYTANSVNNVTNNHKNSIREVVGIGRISG